MDPGQDNPPFDFQALVNTSNNEETAIHQLRSDASAILFLLYDLFDCVLYENFDRMLIYSDTFQARARSCGAYDLAEICQAFRVECQHKTKPAAIEKMKELITGCRRFHTYVFELLKMPKEVAGAEISGKYNIFDVYFDLTDATDHINMKDFSEMFEDDMEFMFTSFLRQMLQHNEIETVYKELLEEDYSELRRSANRLKGQARYLGTELLKEKCYQLQRGANENDEEWCLESFAEVVQEYLYLERFLIIKEAQGGEPKEKLIKLPEKLTTRAEGRMHELLEVVKEIKHDEKKKRYLRELKQEEDEEPLTEHPPLNFIEFVNRCESKEEAIFLLQERTEVILSFLYKLLDCIIYEDFEETWTVAEELQVLARYLEAPHLGDISQICGVHSKNKDKTALKENMKELIVESKRLYFYTLQLSKMRKKDIDSELRKAFEIFEMCLGLKDAANHMDMVGFRKVYVNWKSKLEEGFHKPFTKENYFETMFAQLVEKDYSSLKASANEMKRSASFSFQPTLTNLCEKLEGFASEHNQQGCKRSLIKIVEECLFLERLDMNRPQRVDPQKRIKLSEDIVWLIKGKNTLPKFQYYIKKENERSRRLQKDEKEELKAECQDAVRSRQSSHNDAGQKIGRILESIPEEELKELESARGHQNIQNIQNNPIGYLEEKKTDAHASSIIQPKGRVLDMPREYKEDIIDLSDSPSRKTDSINVQSEEEKIKINSKIERENDKEDGNIVIVSKKKLKDKEEDEDYYPFDTGMKCSMF